MKKAGLLLLLCASLNLAAQTNALDYKKGNKVIQRVWTGSLFSFLRTNHQFESGILLQVKKDSFLILPFGLRQSIYSLDTIWFPQRQYPMNEVKALLKRGYKLHETPDGYAIQGSAGHVHWYWVKSGWLFRTGAIGYTGLSLLNSAIDDKITWKNGHYAVAAGFFLAGWIMKKKYTPFLPIKGNRHLDVFM